MAFIKGQPKIYKIVLEDKKVSGDKATFFCRKPTTSERVKYQNHAVIREGNELEFQVAEAHAEYGLKIITDITEGDFFLPKEEHEGYTSGLLKDAECEDGYLTISSDKKSPFFYSKWRDVVRECAPDFLIEIGKMFFEGGLKQNKENP